MKKYNLRIYFFWDDCDDVYEFSIDVPQNVTVSEIEEALIESHVYLDTEDETDLYGTTGRNPVTLLDYVCNKHGWHWEDFSFDIDLNFN